MAIIPILKSMSRLRHFANNWPYSIREFLKLVNLFYILKINTQLVCFSVCTRFIIKSSSYLIACTMVSFRSCRLHDKEIHIIIYTTHSIQTEINIFFISTPYVNNLVSRLHNLAFLPDSFLLLVELKFN